MDVNAAVWWAIGALVMVLVAVALWRWYTVFLDELFPEDPYAYPTFDECRHPETVTRPFGLHDDTFEWIYGPAARDAIYCGDAEVCLACGARRLHYEWDSTCWRPGIAEEEADLAALRFREHGAKQPHAAGGRSPAEPSRKEALLPHSR